MPLITDLSLPIIGRAGAPRIRNYPVGISGGSYEANLRDAMEDAGIWLEPTIRRGLEAAVNDLRNFRGAALDCLDNLV